MSNSVKLYVKKTGLRSFSAAVRFRNEWVVGKGKQSRTAIKALEEKILSLGGVIPPWTITMVEEVPVPASKPTTPAISPVAHVPNPAEQPAENPAPATESDDAPPTLRDPSLVAEMETDTAEKPEETYTPPEAPAAPPAMDAGWITPISDPAAWQENASLCMNKVLSLGYVLDKETNGKFRNDVNALMESLGFIGAYRPTPSGLMWIRMTKLQDPTTRPIQAGEGNRRKLKDINGYWTDGQGRSMQLMDRKGNSGQKSGEKKESGSKAKEYTYSGTKEQYALAYKVGREMSKKATETGQDPRIAYKLGICVSLRSQNAPIHTKFEEDLKALGVDVEKFAIKAA